MTNYRTAFGYLPPFLTGLVSMGIYHRVRVRLSQQKVLAGLTGHSEQAEGKTEHPKTASKSTATDGLPCGRPAVSPCSLLCPQNRAKTVSNQITSRP